MSEEHALTERRVRGAVERATGRDAAAPVAPHRGVAGEPPDGRAGRVPPRHLLDRLADAGFRVGIAHEPGFSAR